MRPVKKCTYLFKLLFCFCFPFVLNGQDGSSTTFSNVVPPSPTPASLAKVVEVPVNLASGTPSIDIPLYTLQGKKLSLPISLSYHAGGIRVEELAGWAGLGWSLNAGGVIARTLRGLPDEHNNGYLNYDYGQTLDAATLNSIASLGYAASFEDQALIDIARGLADTEPDIFYFNFAGYTGKIMFSRPGVPVIIPHQDLKVESSIQGNYQGGWKITTPDGAQYIFADADRETSYSETECIDSEPSVNQYTSSWYLSEIKHANNNSTISFFYDTEMDLQYDTRQSETVYEPKYLPYQIDDNGQFGYFDEADVAYTAISSIGCNRLPNVCSTLSSVTAQHLSRIETEYFSADFIGSSREDLKDNGGRKLERIQIKSKPGEVLIKEFVFAYSYFEATQNVPGQTVDAYERKRLKLVSLTESGQDGTSLPPYEFAYSEDYQLPPRNSFAQDHWGYYNGEDGNNTLIPESLNSEPIHDGGAVRTPSEEHVKAGALEQITYPTGGITTMEFEPHVYGYEPRVDGFMEPDVIEEVGILINDTDITNNEIAVRITERANICPQTACDKIYDEITFTLPYGQEVKADWMRRNDDPSPEECRLEELFLYIVAVNVPTDPNFRWDANVTPYDRVFGLLTI